MKIGNIEWSGVIMVATYSEVTALAERKKADGWRMPTFSELDQALYEDTWRNFVECPKIPIWSLAGESGEAWVVFVNDFSKYEMPINTNFKAAVMLVKDS